jgi:PiT family inorganic phosphate transporter
MALLGQHIIHMNHGEAPEVPRIVVVACAAAMALGTMIGGKRIMKTMGHKIARLEPVHGFVAQTTASIVVLIAGHFHAPISTTQAISGSIFGVGSVKRFSAVKWGVAQRMIVAWLLTLPASATVAAICYYILSHTPIH